MKYTRFAILFLVLSPSVAYAAWWNPLTWSGQKNSQPVGISQGLPVKPPTIEELQGRIADLERQLSEALAKLASTTPKVVVQPTTQTQSTDSSGLSQKQVASKVQPAMVFIETATSSGSGSIIDSAGHILTDAHTVWAMDPNNKVVGAADTVTVTLSNGDKKSAKLVGIDEGHDLAVLQLSNKSASSYLKLNFDSGLSKGDSVYVFSLPLKNGGSTGGSATAAGSITKIDSNSISMDTETKPYDTGGALVTARGNFIGIPNKSTCKVIQDMTTCLKYTVTSNNIKNVVPKLLAGMILYKQKPNETPEEINIHGQLDGMYQSVSNGSVIDFAIANVSGNNSFDLFNSKLGQDTEGKIAKLYMMKLKQIADSMYQAVDFLKSKSYDLNVFLLGESGPISSMGDYQRATLAKIQADNALKVKEYSDKVAFWSKKRNEYDGYIPKSDQVTHDYLMTEGAYEESFANYLIKERQRVLNVFSGDAVNIF